MPEVGDSRVEAAVDQNVPTWDVAGMNTHEEGADGAEFLGTPDA